MDKKEKPSIIFRERKVLFSESMSTIQHFNSMFDLKDHLSVLDKPYHRSVKHVKFVPDGFDDRNEWECYRVEVFYNKARSYEWKGYSNGILASTK